MSEQYMDGFLDASMDSLKDKKKIDELKKEVDNLNKLVKSLRVYGNMCELCNKENISPKNPNWILRDPPVGKKRPRQDGQH